MSEESQTEESQTEESQIEESEQQILLQKLPQEPRALGIFQDIDEKKTEEIIYALTLYAADNKDPVEFYVSTNGGSATDMFAVYDYIRTLRDDIDICTYGLGKVMSAGVLLLACGSPGKRKIGKYCRVMIHSVIGGSMGALHDLENEMQEIHKIQEMYIEALCAETKFTKKKLKDMISKNVNVYLSAEEAVKYGIADIIV